MNFIKVKNYTYGPTVPFKSFYSNCTPEIFFLLLKNELPQTIAFILSFCRKKTFIKKVLLILQKDSFYKDYLHEVVGYLENCNKPFDQFFTRTIEKYCEKSLDNYLDGSNSEFFRKNIFLGKKLVKLFKGEEN
jgi:flagellar motor switch protein FliG